MNQLIAPRQKIYDASAAFLKFAADVSINGGTATFSDLAVGPGKTVEATGLTLLGVDAASFFLEPN